MPAPRVFVKVLLPNPVPETAAKKASFALEYTPDVIRG